MQRIQWTKALATGNDVIDARHQELFRRADGLVEGLGKKLNGELGQLVDFLYACAVESFSVEEGLMRERRFPGLERHKAQHDRFVSDLLLFAADLKRHRDNAFLADRVARWLGAWLDQHVSSTDRELAGFLARAPKR